MVGVTPPSSRPLKASRIELRASQEDRDLLDRAAAALGIDRSSFLLSQGRLAAQQVLADREHFVLDAAAQQEWEWASPGLVDTDQGSTWVIVRAAMNCCS